jgi:hypothetical protein
MMTLLCTYLTAVGYSIIAREAFGISAHSPWNWGVAAGIVGLGIVALWADKN